MEKSVFPLPALFRLSANASCEGFLDNGIFSLFFRGADFSRSGFVGAVVMIVGAGKDRQQGRHTAQGGKTR